MPKLWSRVVLGFIYFGAAIALLVSAVATLFSATEAPSPAGAWDLFLRLLAAPLLMAAPGRFLELLRYQVAVYRAFSRYAFKLSDGGGEVDHAAAEHKGFQVLRMEFDDVCNEALDDALATRARERDAVDAAAEAKP
jgi:hypothetical protein